MIGASQIFKFLQRIETKIKFNKLLYLSTGLYDSIYSFCSDDGFRFSFMDLLVKFFIYSNLKNKAKNKKR